jgi:hypothetical protein
MEQTECSEMSAYKIHASGNYPEEITQNSEHGESLKSRIRSDFSEYLKLRRHCCENLKFRTARYLYYKILRSSSISCRGFLNFDTVVVWQLGHPLFDLCNGIVVFVHNCGVSHYAVLCGLTVLPTTSFSLCSLTKKSVSFSLFSTY